MIYDELNVRTTSELITISIKELMKNKSLSALEILEHIENKYGTEHKDFARNYILDYCNM